MSINCKEIKDKKSCIEKRPNCVWVLNPERCEPVSNSLIKIPGLLKVPPSTKSKGTSGISSIRNANQAAEVVKLPPSIFIKQDKSNLDSDIKTTGKTEPISTLPAPKPLPLKTPLELPLPSSKPLVFSEIPTSSVGDECEQLNLFKNKQSSCYLDSLVFGLVHIQNNKFIDELKTMIDKSETCKNRIINYLINMHTQIHNRSVPVKCILLDDLRELLFECQSQGDRHDKKFYISEQQDVNEFINIILNLIEPSETSYYDVRELRAPKGNNDLVQKFPNYKPAKQSINSYNTHMIYPETNSTNNIDLRFNQIIDEFGNNIFQFSLPDEANITYDIANDDYPYVVDYIYKNNLIDSSIVENIKQIFPNFFSEKISDGERAIIYKEIYKIFRDSLPKLTYTIMQNSKIYYKPINYFIISIVRENIEGGRNNYKLINVPDRIHSYDKTLELVSAVIHHGDAHIGHYICYFKCGSNWYIMDDLHQSIKKYKPFDITDTDIMTNCRLLIYM